MQGSEFFEPIGMFHRNFPWAPVENKWFRGHDHCHVPEAISVETYR